MQQFDTRPSLERAQELIASGEESNLRYAALELRFCIEAITYKKLDVYKNLLTPKLIDMWQPPQAIKALLKIEPSADRDFILRYREESAPGNTIGKAKLLGKHNALKAKWISKNYNKLGSYLHVPTAKQRQNNDNNQQIANMQIHMKSVVQELIHVLESTIDSSLANTSQFRCEVCQTTSVCHTDHAIKQKLAICLKPDCGAEYRVQKINNELKFHLMATAFECHECDHSTLCENRKLKIGFNFSCESCGQEHELITRQWGYAPTITADETTDQRPK